MSSIFTIAREAAWSSWWVHQRIVSANREIREVLAWDHSLPNSIFICKKKLLDAWIDLQSLSIEGQKAYNQIENALSGRQILLMPQSETIHHAIYLIKQSAMFLSYKLEEKKMLDKLIDRLFETIQKVEVDLSKDQIFIKWAEQLKIQIEDCEKSFLQLLYKGSSEEDLKNIEAEAISNLELLKKGPCNAKLSNAGESRVKKYLEVATESVERISKSTLEVDAFLHADYGFR